MRKGTKQTGKFQIQEGMAFTMPSMKQLHTYGMKIKANIHPWLIVNKFEDYVEIVMCTTLSSNEENKHRISLIYNDNNNDNITDILHPCPPMDRPNNRMSGVSLDTAMLLPIKELFSNPIQILNNNNPRCNFTTHGLKALCLQQPDLRYLQKELSEYQQQHPDKKDDPFHCYEQIGYVYNLEDGDPVPKGFTKESYDKQFGWQHIKPANPYAIYPFEDQMYDYEKQDPELVKIARLKKQAIQKQKRKQQAEDKFGHIQANSPDTELGLRLGK